MCRLVFARTSYHYKEIEFQVGISDAQLRLTLEGCESTLDARYGETRLPIVTEEQTVEKNSDLTLNAQISASVDELGDFATGAGGKMGVSKSARSFQSSVRLPVEALPNDAWRIRSVKPGQTSSDIIEGTAIAGECICSIRRKFGGNRILIVGEVHVSKSSIRVSAVKGNFWGKFMSEKSGKEAIVGLILKKAIQREATSRSQSGDAQVVAVSRCEIKEK
jgi:hypothetical protein